jgi:haloalkane dehalogenase
MEAIVRPFSGWDEWTPSAVTIFQGFRSEKGEQMILERNLFVERVLPGSVLRKLTDREMAEYRKPYLAVEDRWPTLSWPREIPIAGEPADVAEIARDYGNWMAQNEIPKLFINAEPGAILTGAARESCRQWQNQTEVTLAGSHFLQEDSGPAIRRAISDWIEAKSL